MIPLLLVLLHAALAGRSSAPPSGPAGSLDDTPSAGSVAPAPAAAPLERREARKTFFVYSRPNASSTRRGMVQRGEAFDVWERVPGAGCAAGWARLAVDGYACLDGSQPTTREPAAFPRPIAFDHPRPAEYESYARTGKWQRDVLGPDEGLVPFIYGKRWRRWQGQFYASAKALERGDPPLDPQPETFHKFRFEELRTTKRQGELLVRPDGAVVRREEIFLYPVSDFAGRDLLTDPVPVGRIPAWVHGYKGAPLLAAPAADAEVLQTLPYHTRLELDAAPADVDGRFWRVPDALGPGQDGYIDDTRGVRRWSVHPVPSGVGPDDVWVDVDVNQQMLTLFEGWRPVYVTMVSTGEPGHGTPLGVFRVLDKMAWVDMASRDDAPEEEKYLVEAVPWTIHFEFRYALHAAYWHWGYGNRASHGCVNLSPRDARAVYERLSPIIPDGWFSIFETAGDPGSVIRIRAGAEGADRDRRKPPGAKR